MNIKVEPICPASEKIRNSQIVKILSLIVHIGLIIGVIFFFWIGGLLLIRPIFSESQTWNIPRLAFQGISLSQDIPVVHVSEYILSSLALLASLFFGLLLLWNLRFLIMSLKTKDPFTLTNAKRIKRIGLYIILSVYLKQITIYCYIQAISRQFTSENSETLISYTFTLFPPEIIWGLALILLSQIFLYGAALQKEYDMTI